MSHLRRFAILILGLSLTFLLLPAAPANATFNAICYVSAAGLPSIRLQADPDGGVTFYAQTRSGDGRFFQIRPAGGHWEMHMLHNLPDAGGLDLDAEGYPIVIHD